MCFTSGYRIVLSFVLAMVLVLSTHGALVRPVESTLELCEDVDEIWCSNFRNLLVVVKTDRSLWFYDTRTGERIWTYCIPSQPRFERVRSIGINSSGNRVIVEVERNSFEGVYDTVVLDIGSSQSWVLKGVRHACFSQDAKLIIAESNGRIDILNAESLEYIDTLCIVDSNINLIYAMRFNADNTKVAICADSGVTIYDVLIKKALYNVPCTDFHGYYEDVCFVPDGVLIVQRGGYVEPFAIFHCDDTGFVRKIGAGDGRCFVIWVDNDVYITSSSSIWRAKDRAKTNLILSDSCNLCNQYRVDITTCVDVCDKRVALILCVKPGLDDNVAHNLPPIIAIFDLTGALIECVRIVGNTSYVRDTELRHVIFCNSGNSVITLNQCGNVCLHSLSVNLKGMLQLVVALCNARCGSKSHIGLVNKDCLRKIYEYVKS